MSGATLIDWCHAVWNPFAGCYPVSPGCANCYAAAFASRFSGEEQPYYGLATRGRNGPAWTGRVQFSPKILQWPMTTDLPPGRAGSRKFGPKWASEARARGERPRVFVASMSDPFHSGFNFDHIAATFGVMSAKPEWDFVLLTKRMSNALLWNRQLDIYAEDQRDPGSSLDDARISVIRECARSLGAKLPPIEECMQSWPLQNVYFGVSIENQEQANLRAPELMLMDAAYRIFSLEPLLGPLDLSRWMFNRKAAIGLAISAGLASNARQAERRVARSVDWVILGGESGNRARETRVSHIVDVAEAGVLAGVPVFVKQLGSRPIGEPWVKANGKVVTMHHHIARRGEIVLSHPKGGDPNEWPESLRHLRQIPKEMLLNA